MSAPIDTYHAVAVVEEEQHLSVPVIGTERPSVVKNDGLPVSPVFVEDIDTVFGCDRAHLALLLCQVRVM
jgi:hypothetical protein